MPEITDQNYLLTQQYHVSIRRRGLFASPARHGVPIFPACRAYEPFSVDNSVSPWPGRRAA